MHRSSGEHSKKRILGGGVGSNIKIERERYTLLGILIHLEYFSPKEGCLKKRRSEVGCLLSPHCRTKDREVKEQGL